MRATPTLVEVVRNKRDVIACFVACGFNGDFQAFAIDTKSRYDMGTARPIEIGTWRVAFLSRDEFMLDASHKPGDIVQFDQSYHVLVSIDGGEIKMSSGECVGVLKRHVQQKEQKREEEKRLKKQQADYSKDLSKRRSRIEQNLQSLVDFPELEHYRTVLEQEIQAQLYFDQQGLDAVDILEVELSEANKREAIKLAAMRQKAQQLRRERQQQREAERQIEQKRLEEERANRRQQDNEKLSEQEKLEGHRKWKENSDRIVVEYNRREQRHQTSQRSVPTSGGGCILIILPLLLGTISLLGVSFSIILHLVLLLNR